jgi:hypothetical protein
MKKKKERNINQKLKKKYKTKIFKKYRKQK